MTAPYGPLTLVSFLKDGSERYQRAIPVCNTYLRLVFWTVARHRTRPALHLAEAPVPRIDRHRTYTGLAKSLNHKKNLPLGIFSYPIYACLIGGGRLHAHRHCFSLGSSRPCVHQVTRGPTGRRFVVVIPGTCKFARAWTGGVQLHRTLSLKEISCGVLCAPVLNPDSKVSQAQCSHKMSQARCSHSSNNAQKRTKSIFFSSGKYRTRRYL
jgi:hypothetical protein